MPEPKSIPLVDGWTNLIGGMDANRRPRLIDPNQYALGVNITTRGGFPQTRPSFLYRTLIFANDENEEWFKTQIYQGGFNYTYVGASKNPSVTTECIVCSVGGRIWKIDKCTYVVEEITPGGRAGRNSRCGSLAYFVQAEQWLVIQDGTSKAILWDGGVARRAGYLEVPVGTVMAYGQGRIWLIQGPRLLAGDLVGSYPNAVIGFQERTFLATNGDLYPSFTVGRVNALQFIPQQDTATGVGSLLVIGERGVSSVYAEKERSEWVTGISRVTLINVGGTGHRAATSVNGDVWFESPDGWRSYRHARGVVQQDVWYQLPFSLEVSIFTQTTASFLKPYSSFILWDNRLLGTTGAIWQNGRCSFRGVLALDFNALSTFDQATRPDWEGVWTGVNVMELIRGANDAWAFGIDESGLTSLYQITTTQDTPVDDLRLGGPVPIECQLVTGSYVFANYNHAGRVGIDAQKFLSGGNFSVRDLKGRVEISVEYRKDGEVCFQPWRDFSLCTQDNLCTQTCAINALTTGYRNRLMLPDPRYNAQEEQCDVNQQLEHGGPQIMSFGYEFQQKMIWTGRCTISYSFLQSIVVDEQDLAACYDVETCIVQPNCCYDPYDFTPRFPPYIRPPFPPASPGCTDPAAINYNPLADPGDGSCRYPLGGCTDPTAFNYNPEATYNDGSCVPVIYGCTQSGSTNFNPHANTDDGSCIPCVYGCMDSMAPNYDPEATCDDGSCEISSPAQNDCTCPQIYVPYPPPSFAIPNGATIFDRQLPLYQDSLNSVPAGGYKQVVGFTYGSEQNTGFPPKTNISIICLGTPPTLLGTSYFDDADGIWFTYNPIGVVTDVGSCYIVQFYTTGLLIWFNFYAPAYPGGPNILNLQPTLVADSPFVPPHGKCPP